MAKTKKLPNNLIVALATIVLGVLFIVLKGEVVSIAMTVLGVALIIAGVIDIVNKLTTEGVIKAVLGVALLVCGWTLVSLALYIMAAVLLIYGILLMIEIIKNMKKSDKMVNKVLKLVEPVVMIIVAACLLFNQGGAIAWVFILAGILLIVDGALGLVNALRK